MIRDWITFFKKLIRPSLGFLRKYSGVILFAFLKVLCQILRPNIFFTYLNTSKADGVGAQVQRILATRCLSASLNLGYVHTRIASLAIHPLDPYQSKMEMEDFLLKLNGEFWMADSDENLPENFQECEIATLTFPFLLSCVIKSKFSKTHILIRLIEPYPISEHDSNLYQNVLQFLPRLILPQNKEETIAIHYRRGVGGFAIQRGESIPREISGAYFASILNEIIRENQQSVYKVLVFTDSPTEDVIFTPPADQSELWSNSMHFSEGKMHVLGLDVQEVFKDVRARVEVYYGGDPLDVIKSLATADHLILSRSSFGYLAALLNEKGKVYFPSLFWHAPKRGWRVIKESNYI